MSDFVRLDIEVSPVVKKFLDYFLHENEMKVSRSTLFGMTLIHMIQQVPYGWKPTKIEESRNLKVRVYDHIDYRKSRHFYVSPQSASDFNLHVRKIFNLFFYLHVTLAVVVERKKINDGILSFRQKFLIEEEDLTFEAQKKDFYRLRKEYNNMTDSDLQDLDVICPFLDGLMHKILTS